MSSEDKVNNTRSGASIIIPTPLECASVEEKLMNMKKRGRPKTLSPEEAQRRIIESQKKCYERRREFNEKWKKEAPPMQKLLLKMLKENIYTNQIVIDKMFEIADLMEESTQEQSSIALTK